MKNFVKSWFGKHSIKFKMNLSILTCVFLCFLGLMIIISKKSEPIIKEQIDEIAQKSVEMYAADFAHLITDAEQIIINTKNALSQISKDDTKTLNVVLSSAIKTVYHSELSFSGGWVYIFPPENVSQGKLYSAIDNDDGLISFKTEKIENFYNHFPWFKAVPKEEKIFWSEPYRDVETGETVVTCLIPFKFLGQKELNGLVALTVDLSKMHRNSLKGSSFYRNGRLLLLSKTGLYVTHPNPNIALRLTIFQLSRMMKLPQLGLVGKHLAAGKSGQAEIPHSSVINGPAIFFYAPIKNIKWGFCLIYSKDELLKPIRQFKWIVGLSLLMFVALMLLITERIGHYSVNQLITLCDVAEKYGKGDFSENFDEMPTSSDINRLATAIADMKSDILEYVNKEREEATEKQKNESELEIARHIQKSALSTKYPQNAAFELATTMVPARLVAGDFYDFFFIDDNKFAIVIADVSGKGIPASLYMMKAITLIKNISRSKMGLDSVFDHVNKQLCEGNDTCMFVTAFMAVVDLLTGKAKYVNAGHLPPLLNNGKEKKFINVKTNVALGVYENATFAEEEIDLEPGAHLLLYTDGVTEAENKTNKFYGSERLLKAFSKANSTPADNLDLVMKDVKRFIKGNPRSDDIAMLDFIFHGYEPGTIILPARMEKVQEFLMYLKDDMIAHKLSKKAIFNMVMSAEEIFANIVRYAYDTKDNATVTIKTRQDDEMYYVKFIDRGKKYNPLKNEMPDITVDIKERKIGGLGVLLVKKLADSTSYKWQNKQNILEVGVKMKK